MTHHPDPTAAREAAERLRALESYCLTGQHPGQDAYSPYDPPFVHDVEDDRRTITLAYLALTDPTPLTVDVLVGMGGIENGEHIVDFAGFNVFHGGGPEAWLWDKPFSGESLMLSPRTAGELRQLLQRLEK